MVAHLIIYFIFLQVFKVQHISVKAGSTPLPAVWALEESHDFSSDFKAIRYYVADQEDCFPFFGLEEGPLCFLRPNFSWEETENVGIDSFFLFGSYFVASSNIDQDCPANRPFSIVCLVTWPWIGSEAGGDLVLIQTSLLFICRSCCSYAN